MNDNFLSNMQTYSGKPVTETITNGFFTVDRKWIVKSWNKAAEKLLGVPAKDILEKNLWEKFAKDIPLNIYAAYHKSSLTDIPVYFQEYWIEMGAWFEVNTYYSNDALSFSFKSSYQLSQLNNPEHPEQQLKAMNELYRFVTEVTNDCLWEWHFHAKEIFWIDGGHKRAFGYHIQNSLIPQSFWENRLHFEDKPRVLAKLNKVIAEGTAILWEDEYRFQKADGSYAYVHDRGHIIYVRGKISRMVGATNDISDRIILENKLAQERLTKQREINDAVLTAQENERAEIGKELHDNVNQILVAATLYIGMAKKDEANKKIHLDQACGYIKEVIEEIRKISKILIPVGIQHIGLMDSIKDLSEDLAGLYPIKIELHNDGMTEHELSEKLKLNIFRMVQEQLNNILKHSKATHATVNIAKKANEIILIIADDGEDCDILKREKGIDITNIKSRADLFDGKATVLSIPGKGFQLKVILPLNNTN